jgi:pimeloyl-ACP methyl ester carboxylesterase
MSYEAMTDDLVEFINHQQLQRVSLIGHSMGGKVAMCLALRKPSVVDRLVVVDVAPEVSKGGAQIKFLAEAMKELNIKQILSKTQADEMLKEKVPVIVTHTHTVFYISTLCQFIINCFMVRHYLWLFVLGLCCSPVSSYKFSKVQI